MTANILGISLGIYGKLNIHYSKFFQLNYEKPKKKWLKETNIWNESDILYSIGCKFTCMYPALNLKSCQAKVIFSVKVLTN